jgi:hypothetical protein
MNKSKTYVFYCICSCRLQSDVQKGTEGKLLPKGLLFTRYTICFCLSAERTHSLVRFYCEIEANVHQVFEEGRNPKPITLPFRCQQLGSFLQFVPRAYLLHRAQYFLKM